MTETTNSKAAKIAKDSAKPMKKLTRAQITEGLSQFPVEVLLSSGKGKQAQLTTKQRNFAHSLAMGATKAQAYRDSYKQDATPATLAGEPYRVAADPRISAEVDAYRLAIEAEKHRTPAQLKSLLVQQLVQHSLDQDFPPAQRVQCLKLLGSLFEVGAFVERKEVTTVNRSGDIRARILDTLKDVTDITALDDGLSLLEELGQYSQQPPDKNISTTNTTKGAEKHGETLEHDKHDVVLEDNPAGPPFVESLPADPTAGAPEHIGAAHVGVTTHSIPLK